MSGLYTVYYVFAQIHIHLSREAFSRHLHTNMRRHIPHMATTLEIWSARPHSALIRQSLVRRQHLGQLLPEEPFLSESDSSPLLGWVCLVSRGFSSHSSLAPLPMMLLARLTKWSTRVWEDRWMRSVKRKYHERCFVFVPQLHRSWAFTGNNTSRLSQQQRTVSSDSTPWFCFVCRDWHQ